jgi:hypothetical protein
MAARRAAMVLGGVVVGTAAAVGLGRTGARYRPV